MEGKTGSLWIGQSSLHPVQTTQKNKCSPMHHLRDIQARRKKLPFNQLIYFPLNQPSNEQAHQCSITMHILHQSWKHTKIIERPSIAVLIQAAIMELKVRIMFQKFGTH